MEEGGSIGDGGFAARQARFEYENAKARQNLNYQLGIGSPPELPPHHPLDLEEVGQKQLRTILDLHNLDLSGGGQTFKNQHASGIGIGGRVGYSIPIDANKDVNVGLSGG